MTHQLAKFYCPPPSFGEAFEPPPGVQGPVDATAPFEAPPGVQNPVDATASFEPPSGVQTQPVGLAFRPGMRSVQRFN